MTHYTICKTCQQQRMAHNDCAHVPRTSNVSVSSACVWTHPVCSRTRCSVVWLTWFLLQNYYWRLQTTLKCFWVGFFFFFFLQGPFLLFFSFSNILVACTKNKECIFYFYSGKNVHFTLTFIKNIEYTCHNVPYLWKMRALRTFCMSKSVNRMSHDNQCTLDRCSLTRSIDHDLQ